MKPEDAKINRAIRALIRPLVWALIAGFVFDQVVGQALIDNETWRFAARACVSIIVLGAMLNFRKSLDK